MLNLVSGIILFSLRRNIFNNHNSVHYPDTYSPRSSCTYNFSRFVTLIAYVYPHFVCRLHGPSVGLDKEDFDPGIVRTQGKGR